MTKPSSSISREEFDSLIARASKLDDEGNERIELTQARAIAQELGISASAWDVALQERNLAMQLQPTPDEARPVRKFPSRIVIAGLVAGALSGAAAHELSDGVLYLGAAAIAAAVMHVVNRLPRQSVRSLQVDLSAWWVSIAAGIMIGMPEPNGDPLVFAGVSWAWCAGVAWILDRVRRRSGTLEPAEPNTITG